MTTTEATAAVLKYSRERAGLSQLYLSRKMKTSRTHISKIENAKLCPDLNTLDKWGIAIDVPSHQLLKQINLLKAGKVYIPMHSTSLSSCIENPSSTTLAM